MENVVENMEVKKKHLKVKKSLKKAIDNAIELCDNVQESTILLDRMRSYEISDEKKRKALVDYLNSLFNTGENE